MWRGCIALVLTISPLTTCGALNVDGVLNHNILVHGYGFSKRFSSITMYWSISRNAFECQLRTENFVCSFSKVHNACPAASVGSEYAEGDACLICLSALVQSEAAQVRTSVLGMKWVA